ncbi:8340_t:CDS:2, partial [Racocetra persica]
GAGPLKLSLSYSSEFCSGVCYAAPLVYGPTCNANIAILSGDPDYKQCYSVEPINNIGTLVCCDGKGYDAQNNMNWYGLSCYLSIKSRNGWKSSKVDWDEEVVVITGGSRGLGNLLAETLAIRNVTVVILDIRSPEVENVNITYYECDVSKLEDVQRVAKEIIDE